MATSGTPPGLQSGSQRNSLNPEQFPSGDAMYNQQGYSLLPPNYHPQFENIDVKEPSLLSSQQDLNNSQQFSDYPLYSTTDDFALPTSASINPAELSLLNSYPANSSHHGTPQLPIDSNPPHHEQQGSDNYLSSPQPSGTGGAVEWEQVFRHSESWHGHRRAPSEYSEISSVAPSPYLSNQEFNEQPSPLIAAQHYPEQGPMQDLLNSGGPGEAFGLESFTISDRDPSPRVSPSPGYHSESNSPYLPPQDNHLLGQIPTMGLGGQMHDMMASPPLAGHGAGPPTGLGIARDGESFPQINISFAPPQRQPTFPGKPGAEPEDGALRPPQKVSGRRRAKSDPYATGSGGVVMSRPMSSQPGSRDHSPVRGASRERSLSPGNPVTAPVGSPASNTASSKGHRRSSTNSLPNRDYILELAHPNRPGANPGDNKRVQKHPATFQCSLCPKRFTRAYNLRSHLRTHTDERPFVCSICGKAFARQHDRKRHEGLHSGEKKFVCRGNLKAGGCWGCGRRFARADALGRHFRSEAGRVCIRPLLDEETAERQRLQMAQQSGQMLDPSLNCLHSPPDAMAQGMDTASMGISFPSAILEQYPALATMSWGNGDNYDPGEDYDDGGASGFEASGNEYEDHDGSVSGGSAMSSKCNSYDGGYEGWRQ